MMNIIEENVLIAKWLGWTNHKSDFKSSNKDIKADSYWWDNDNDLIFLEDDQINFHTNFNMQLFCLQKIMKDNELKSLRQVFSLLEDIQSEIKDEAVDISTKLDIFNAIVSYINKS